MSKQRKRAGGAPVIGDDEEFAAGVVEIPRPQLEARAQQLEARARSRAELGLATPATPAEQLPLVLADARATHRATRARVDAEGDPITQVLYEAFDLWNAEHFGGALEAPLIHIAPASSGRAMGSYTARTPEGLRSCIRIPPATVRRGLRDTLATLLHEMVHAWCHERAGDDEPGYRGHGPVFCGKANEIGAKHGWPDVAPKSRGGLNPSHWPHLPPLEGETLPTKVGNDLEPSDPVEPSEAADAIAGEDFDVDELLARERAGVAAWLRVYARHALRETFGKRGNRRRARRLLHQLAMAIEAGTHARPPAQGTPLTMPGVALTEPLERAATVP
jgi:hypothetical protein